MKLKTSVVQKMAIIMSVIAACCWSLQAQTIDGKAEVRAIKGSATYAAPGVTSEPLKVGTVLGTGAVIKTGPDSTVDLFMGNSAGVIRVTENSTLALEKLTLTDTGADTVVEVLLNLPEGTILGNVNKLSAASKYEIKVPNGVAGIRGTRFRISSTSYIVLLDGTFIYVFVPPGGNPTPYTMVAPPAVYFSPVEGIKPAPEELIREVTGQLGRPFTPPGPPPATPFREPFVSPGTGTKPNVGNNPGQGNNP